jgi:xylan 1,4-beta-xylosidase
MSIGVRPVVELSFMPRALVNCTPDQCSYAFDDPAGGYKGLVMPPKNFNDWYLLVQALAGHLVERYGLEEVSQWDFEVWNGAVLCAAVLISDFKE